MKTLGKVLFALYALGTLAYATYSNVWLGTRIFNLATKFRPEAYNPDYLLGQYVLLDWACLFLFPVMIVVTGLMMLIEKEN